MMRPLSELPMSAELFSVYQFFPDDTHECVGMGLDAEAAVLKARSYTTRPAAQLGIIRKVIITDSGDACVFEWRHGEGVVFPPRSERAQ